MSVMCKLDPRTKLILILIFTILIFIVNNILTIVCLTLFITVIRILSKVPFNGVKFFKNLSLLAFFLVTMQTLFGPGENYIVNPLFPPVIPIIGGAFSLKWEGLFLGLIILCRLISIMILFPVFTETTSVSRLASGLCSFGLNYKSAFIITMAFNNVSRLKEEAVLIMDAQKLRGMRQNVSIFTKFKNMSGLVLPLVLGAMRKARNSSIIMECRAFGIYKTRTWLYKPKMSLLDCIFLSLNVIICSCFLLVNYILGR